MTTILAVSIAYLWGAIPSAYLAVRYIKHVDIRNYGSGNVGAANVRTHMGIRHAIWIATFDVLGKGTIPIITIKLLNQDLLLQIFVGLALIAGHNWSIYIRFTGGRGISVITGVLIGLSMWPGLLTAIVLFGGIGRFIYRETGFWSMVSIIMFPLWTHFFNRPQELTYGMIGFATLIIVKRLTANWEKPTEKHRLVRVLGYRLILDRDVSDSTEWTNRLPSAHG